MKNKVMLTCLLLVLVTGCRTLITPPQQVLHRAVLSGNLAEVKRLLEEGSDVNAKGEYGMTPLMWAAGIGRIEMVKFLLSKGADVNARNTKDPVITGFTKR